MAFSAKWVRVGALLRRRTGGREPPTRALLRLLKFKYMYPRNQDMGIALGGPVRRDSMIATLFGSRREG